jgi:molybdopterin/thiamine biosynthesis adenylyltransferase
MDTLLMYVRNNAEDQLLPWRVQVEAAERFGLPLAQVEKAALEQSILPARYQRNRQTLTVNDQLTLFRSSVAVIGCGGLGGYAIEELARLGVGRLVVVDPDMFEEHNLNRQLLSSPSDLGCHKVEVAARRIACVNPAVTVVPHRLAFSFGNGPSLLASCALAVDALDNIAIRLELAETCSNMGIPMVHGAIAGWYGQVTTLLPGDATLQGLYANHCGGKGIEQHLGNPSFTPAVVASLQVAEVCKLLLGQGNLLHGRTLMIDLLSMEFHELVHK